MILPARLVALSLACATATAAPASAQSLAAVAARSPRGASAPASSPFRAEQEWIVGDIVRHVAVIAAFVNDGRVDNPPPLRVAGVPSREDLAIGATYDVTVATAPTLRVHVTPHVWAAEPYVDVARGLLRPAEPTSAAVAIDEAVPLDEQLLDLRWQTLLDANARTSSRLFKARREPGAHEDAALLLATLAAWEWAGAYTDVRPTLARVAAHLAVARALSPSSTPGRSGALASALCDTLAGRQVAALDAVASLTKQESPALQAWGRALRMRITGDWRPATASAPTTTLERLEYARALATRRSGESVLDYLDTEPDGDLLDWARIALDGRVISPLVDAHNRFGEASLDLQLGQIRATWAQFRDAPLADDAALVAALNVASARTLEVVPRTRALAIVGWTTWASLLHRELVFHLEQSLMVHWAHGSPDSVHEESQRLEQRFGGLWLFPFVQRWTADEMPAYEQAMAASTAVARAHPELVTAELWYRAERKPSWSERLAPFPRATDWFVPFVPSGTAFDLVNRALRWECQKDLPLAHVERWLARAPYDRRTAWVTPWWRMPSGSPSLTQVEATTNLIADYDIDPIRLIVDYLDTVDAAGRMKYLVRWCELDPGQCHRLGWLHAAAGRDDEAVAAFEEMIARSRDTVGTSTQVDWLVRHYADAGDAERALEIAADAGDTGSANGMAILMEQLDRAGRHEDADGIAAYLPQRYHGAAYFSAAQYLRDWRRTGDDRYRDMATTVASSTFPKGIERVVVGDFRGPPTDGANLGSFPRLAEQAGFQKDDVLVAIDGMRLRRAHQFFALCRSSHDQHPHFIVWRRGKYVELQPTLPQRWMGVRFVDYEPSKAKGTRKATARK